MTVVETLACLAYAVIAKGVLVLLWLILSEKPRIFVPTKHYFVRYWRRPSNKEK